MEGIETRLSSCEMIEYEWLVLHGLEGCFLDAGFGQNRMHENARYVDGIRDSPKFGPPK